ncbi:4-hydroxy-3-methylbut-2-enyl diphosphate reductase, chloroplastic-like [Olea europaea subsp. europaea]|uniref:4-hydroxy-3-methylbut-2-enyl diphosphate reductase, chloroplastic-like n=1 Tax=Olea europaea subsp. europaea TaxID=158383 RepID=A0A8S0U8L4_OLEEU|nr:4-hydroxy-3-methylbut-2-enyl diphosphate reductase, chloroplastic-like [Olea europaea subsp. europaea]
MEVKNLRVDYGKKNFDAVNKVYVVILRVFGAAVDEMLVLNDRNVQIVDTIGQWVWNSAEKNKGQYTSIIHGNYSHEE